MKLFKKPGIKCYEITGVVPLVFGRLEEEAKKANKEPKEQKGIFGRLFFKLKSLGCERQI